MIRGGGWGGGGVRRGGGGTVSVGKMSKFLAAGFFEKVWGKKRDAGEVGEYKSGRQSCWTLFCIK